MAKVKKTIRIIEIRRRKEDGSAKSIRRTVKALATEITCGIEEIRRRAKIGC